MSVPEQFAIRRAEDWLLFLPDRLPTFRPGDLPAGLDNWRVEGLRGLGPYAEVWDGYDDDQPDLSPACLKFVTDPKAREAFAKYVPHIKRVLDVDVINGLIPLRSAFVLTSPPCLEYVHLPGYDLANLMHDARWRDDRPRPDQAAMIARRVARIVGKLHRQNPPVVHRGLKPSNVLLCPTNEGRVSVWVSDVGWGQVTAATGRHGSGIGPGDPTVASRQPRAAVRVAAAAGRRSARPARRRLRASACSGTRCCSATQSPGRRPERPGRPSSAGTA